MVSFSSWPVAGLWSRGPLKDPRDSKLILNKYKLFPWSSRISLVPFRNFIEPLFSKPVSSYFLTFLTATGSNPGNKKKTFEIFWPWPLLSSFARWSVQDAPLTLIFFPRAQHFLIGKSSAFLISIFWRIMYILLE